MTGQRWRAAVVGALLQLTLCAPLSAQTARDVLSFLVLNRSIPTGDFVRDEAAAVATRDTISRFLLTELATLPIGSSSGGFTYRLSPALSTVMRSSNSFGPFFAERSLTAGRWQASVGLSYQSAMFDTIDGRNLRDGTLVSTATIFSGDAEPFDVETIALRIRTHVTTLSGNVGLSDRLDIGVSVPVVTLILDGERVDTYRGRAFLQATGFGEVHGLGDAAVRAKYNVLREGGSGVAVGSEIRLPTGNPDNLLGAGNASIKPRLIGSIENDRIGLHGDIGYAFGGLADEFDYNAAFTFVAAPRLTFAAEIAGRRLETLGRLAETIEPHPRLVDVDTVRLTGISEAAHRVVAIAGLKWNIGGTWLLSASALHPLTSAGLNAGWVPTLTFDYSFAR
jgi:hypothetical protein